MLHFSLNLMASRRAERLGDNFDHTEVEHKRSLMGMINQFWLLQTSLRSLNRASSLKETVLEKSSLRNCGGDEVIRTEMPESGKALDCVRQERAVESEIHCSSFDKPKPQTTQS